MVALIECHAKLTTDLASDADGIALDQVKLLAPIPTPRKNIFCVGKNYFAHAQEFTKSGFDATSKRGDNVPDDPIIFTKAPTTVVAQGDNVPCHAEQSSQMDYEAELAVIIGKGGRGITKANAFDHVFGYTIANDVTARDLQLKHRQWFIGKSLDDTCPMGPWISTADEVDAENLDIRCWVNGELRQDANSRDLIFDIPTLIETISAGITLEPGDIISTGTPAGVGIGFKPPRFLVPGDVVRIEIEGLGILENTMI
jgi:2-keto-4-pentenoate hydratase/2-oxohepta-3-ene-1,7-dioic acid hydratase in catechol pathway